MIADRLHYHELQFEADKLAATFTSMGREDVAVSRAEVSPEQMGAQLTGVSQDIVSRLDNWPEHEDDPSVTVLLR